MKPRALGYLGVNAKSLADWADYAIRLAGMQIADKAGGSMALRMDDRKQRLVIEENGGDGVAYFGWEMDDADALGAFCATLDKAGVKAERIHTERFTSPTLEALSPEQKAKAVVGHKATRDSGEVLLTVVLDGKGDLCVIAREGCVCCCSCTQFACLTSTKVQILTQQHTQMFDIMRRMPPRV